MLDYYLCLQDCGRIYAGEVPNARIAAYTFKTGMIYKFPSAWRKQDTAMFTKLKTKIDVLIAINRGAKIAEGSL